MERFTSTADFVLLLSALGSAVLAWIRLIRPWVRTRASERDAINDVLIGRPAVPANPITGDPAQPAKPAIGQQVADMAVVLNEVHHEPAPQRRLQHERRAGPHREGRGRPARRTRADPPAPRSRRACGSTTRTNASSASKAC
ncbi:hypothetical protein G5V59_00145 [Nocardioides sp. W3-2-3]|uniref:hypothetical protein n=1 Tax=Nocardioides convexus TaxID=2712224 RepID=UPI002418AEAC|nr:hypothetical protein [Nocardioides convexus]NGZ99384.1 hypothetical protein [Nocardioides convexus]